MLIAYAHHYPAERDKLEKLRAGWYDAEVSQQKERERDFWHAQQLANSIDRLKDVYIGANLAHREGEQHVPLVFYLADFDDYISYTLRNAG